MKLLAGGSQLVFGGPRIPFLSVTQQKELVIVQVLKCKIHRWELGDYSDVGAGKKKKPHNFLQWDVNDRSPKGLESLSKTLKRYLETQLIF